MNRRLSTPRMPLAVAVYLPEQYPRLLATAEDASDLEATCAWSSHWRFVPAVDSGAFISVYVHLPQVR
jgi:hypothetical protein